jgi:hypothetical protein
MSGMLDILHRIWSDEVGRFGGPMTFRLFLQPAMAAFFAIRDGIKDARLGRPPLWRVLLHGDKAQRSEKFREGLRSTGRVFLLGIGMDLVYQIKQFHRFYPVEALDIAILLAFVPYLLIRGPARRVAGWYLARRNQDQA